VKDGTVKIDGTQVDIKPLNISLLIDSLYSTISINLFSHIENLTLIGTGKINGTGNDLDNSTGDVVIEKLKKEQKKANKLIVLV
jgi:hypothetical protein